MTANSSFRRVAVALGVFLLAASLPLSACKRREKKIRVQQTDEDSATLASVALSSSVC